MAKLRTAARDGEALFVSVICFNATAQAALLALADSDTVALAGELTVKTWTDKEGNARPAADLLPHSLSNRQREAVMATARSMKTRSA